MDRFRDVRGLILAAVMNFMRGGCLQAAEPARQQQVSPPVEAEPIPYSGPSFAEFWPACDVPLDRERPPNPRFEHTTVAEEQRRWSSPARPMECDHCGWWPSAKEHPDSVVVPSSIDRAEALLELARVKSRVACCVHHGVGMGTFTIALTVAGSGRISNVRVEGISKVWSNLYGDASPWGQCMRESVRVMKFPRRRGPPGVVRV
jgi:hypothetical protein